MPFPSVHTHVRVLVSWKVSRACADRPISGLMFVLSANAVIPEARSAAFVLKRVTPLIEMEILVKSVAVNE